MKVRKNSIASDKSFYLTLGVIFILLIMFILFTGVALNYIACDTLINEGYDAEFFINVDGHIAVCYVKTINNLTVQYTPSGHIRSLGNQQLLKKSLEE